MINWLISLIIVSNSLFVYADNESVSINKGTPAPFDGVLLSNNKANQTKAELDNDKLVNQSLQKSIDLYKTKDNYSNNQIQQLLNQNTKLSDSLSKQQSNDKMQQFIWFSLGVLATGLSIYAAKKIITQ